MNFNDRNECEQFLYNNYNGHNNNIGQEKTIFYSFDTQQLVCSYSLTNAVELQVDQYSVTMVLSSSCPEDQTTTTTTTTSSNTQNSPTTLPYYDDYTDQSQNEYREVEETPIEKLDDQRKE